MIPAVIDITIYQGANFRKTFEWQTGTPAAPVNLTGATGAMQIRKTAKSTTAEVTLTTENGGMVISQVTPWAFEIIIPPALSSAMTITSGVYDIEITLGTEVTRVVMGAVTVSQEVTRP